MFKRAMAKLGRSEVSFPKTVDERLAANATQEQRDLFYLKQDHMLGQFLIYGTAAGLDHEIHNLGVRTIVTVGALALSRKYHQCYPGEKLSVQSKHAERHEEILGSAASLPQAASESLALATAVEAPIPLT
jgi:hypothetical protein